MYTEKKFKTFCLTELLNEVAKQENTFTSVN